MERKDYYTDHDYEKGFPLSNCVLYRLNWYYKSGDFWKDLRECIEADGYFGNGMSKWDVVRLFLHIAEDWNKYAANKGYKLIRIGSVLLPEWKVKGYEKYDSENPELLAMAMEILEMFALDYTRNELPLKKPHFSKESKLKPANYKYGETYKHANRHVEDFKNWK